MLMRTLLVLLAFWAGPALAQDTVPYGSLSQPEQISVIQALIEGGDVEQAQILLSGSRFDEGDTGYQAAFLQAVIWRIEGRFAQAEALLRDILAERPDFRLVRLELAQVLAAQGRREGASFQLGVLSDTAESLAEGREFDRVIDTLSPGTGFQASYFLTLAPSTNFNNGASAQTVLIGNIPFRITNTAQSGLGARIGGALTFTRAISEQVQLYTAVTFQRDEYPARIFDTDTAGLRAGLNFGPERERVTLELFGSRRWVDGRQFDDGYGLRLGVRRPLTAALSFQGDLSIERRDYTSNTDSIRRTAAGTLRYALNARSGLRVGLRAEEQDSRTRNLHYDAMAASVGGYVQLGGELLLDLNVEREDRNYALTVLGTRREDDITRVRLGAQWNRLRIGSVVPQISFVHTDNASTIVPFEFEAKGVEITFSQAF